MPEIAIADHGALRFRVKPGASCFSGHHFSEYQDFDYRTAYTEALNAS